MELYVDGVAVRKRELPINTPQDDGFIIGRVPGDRGELREMNGCMENLASSIFQTERLSTHQNELLTQAINNLVSRNASDLAFLGSENCSR